MNLLRKTIRKILLEVTAAGCNNHSSGFIDLNGNFIDLTKRGETHDSWLETYFRLQGKGHEIGTTPEGWIKISNANNIFFTGTSLEDISEDQIYGLIQMWSDCSKYSRWINDSVEDYLVFFGSQDADGAMWDTDELTIPDFLGTYAGRKAIDDFYGKLLGENVRETIRQILIEDLELDISPGDIILTGKFKNKRRQVKDIGEDEDGQPTINGKPILKFKIEKELPLFKKSAATREYIEGLASLISPPPSEQQRSEELFDIQQQIENPFNPDHMQKDLDSNFYQLFANILKNHGHQENAGNIKNISKNLIPLIKDLKEYFSLERPQSLANSLGIPLSSQQGTMASAQTQSYPSGHTIQAYYLAILLHQHHDPLNNILKEELLTLANNISQSRIDAGVHFPSDIQAGITIAYQLFNTRPNPMKKHG